jgi:drug/metabolite transporter (DMT)-like permease
VGDLIVDRLGELAALGAALCWVFTSLAFAAAGRRVGPTAVNLIRILLALIVLAAIHRVMFGRWVPPVDRDGLWYLAASGVIGLSIGDQLLFSALVDVGPRISTLLMTLAPPVAALLAWPLLDEKLGAVAIVGIAVTLAGIAWVVIERPAGASRTAHHHRVRGVLFAAGAGVCQAVGIVLAKIGIGHTRVTVDLHLDPLQATLTRMAFAALGIAVLTVILRAVTGGRRLDASIQVSPEIEHLPGPPPPRRPRSVWPSAMGFIVIGATFGPVLGVSCSLIADDRAEAGIAATLMAMTPVFILPFAVWFERERLSWRAVIGAAVAVTGVSILALTNG